MIKKEIERVEEWNHTFFKIWNKLIRDVIYDYKQVFLDINNKYIYINEYFILIKINPHFKYILNIWWIEVIYAMIWWDVENDEVFLSWADLHYTFLSVDTFKKIKLNIKWTDDIIYKLLPKTKEYIIESEDCFYWDGLDLNFPWWTDSNFKDKYIRVRAMNKNLDFWEAYKYEEKFEINFENSWNHKEEYFNSYYSKLKDYYINAKTLERLNIDWNNNTYIYRIVEEVQIWKMKFFIIKDNYFDEYLIYKNSLNSVYINWTNIKILKLIDYWDNEIYRFWKKYIKVETDKKRYSNNYWIKREHNTEMYIDPYTLEKKPWYLP